MNLYQTISRIVGACTAIFIVLNLVAGAGLLANQFRHQQPKVKPQGPGAPDFSYRETKPILSEPVVATRHSYQQKWVDLRSYEGLPKNEIYQILDDYVYRERFTYEPYTGYADAPNHSPSLNIALDKHGFSYRKNGTDPAPTAFKVFVFGGSTTYGVNVADHQTIPAHIERIIGRVTRDAPLEVRNYGRCGYSWFQELVLFTRLLQSGQRPDHVVFIDGVNLPGPEEVPLGTKSLSEHWDYEVLALKGNALPNFFPLFRWINAFKAREAAPLFAAAREERQPPKKEDSDPAARVIQSYKNFVALARETANQFGVQANFFLQPNRAFQCQTERYRTPLDGGYVSAVNPVYTELHSYQTPGFHSMANLCNELSSDKMLFVDDVHYNDSMNAAIAEEILKSLGIHDQKPDIQG